MKAKKTCQGAKESGIREPKCQGNVCQETCVRKRVRKSVKETCQEICQGNVSRKPRGTCCQTKPNQTIIPVLTGRQIHQKLCESKPKRTKPKGTNLKKFESSQVEAKTI